jgi:phosphatidylserine/phosphatidylglycerophosphate/cardiolipin synthase-like enzyme
VPDHLQLSRRRLSFVGLSRWRHAVAGLLAVALLFAAVGCAPVPTGSGPLAASPAATSTGPANAAAGQAVDAAPVGSWYNLYFTRPEITAVESDPVGGIPDRVAASFDLAVHTIDLAMYEFDLHPLEAALVRAQARGVRIRMVTDTDSLGMSSIQALLQAGVPIVPDGRKALMHDKFVVIDGAVVWTGSMNFTRNDAYRNNNNFIEIRSAPLAQNYTHEFERMFILKQFGPRAAVDTPNPVVTVGGAQIENYFAPRGNVAVHVDEALASAQRNIYFLAFSFTRRDFAQVLLNQATAGLDVRGVFESQQLAAGGDQVWIMLTSGGLGDGIRKDGNPYNMHDKVFIVDKSVVVTGSFNFSASAENSNDENVIIIHDPAIGAAYYAEWERVWAIAQR